MIVKVTLPGPCDVDASVSTKDGSVRMKVTPGLLQKRFAPDESLEGYFDATFFTGEATDRDGKQVTTCILEIGQRVMTPTVDASGYCITCRVIRDAALDELTARFKDDYRGPVGGRT